MKQNIYRQHQRRYLQPEYNQKSRQIRKQQSELIKLIDVTKGKINPIEFQLLNKHSDWQREKEKMKIKDTHQKKIEQLSNGNIKLDSIDPKKVVHNISSRHLTKDEESILSKGLQFCIETKMKNPIEFKTDIELMAFNILKQLHPPGTTSLNGSLSQRIQSAVNQFLKVNKKKRTMNINKNELKALKELVRDKSIVLMKADKGSSCVVMDKKWYKSKVEKLLSSGNSFIKMNDQDERGNPNTIEQVIKKMENKLNHRLIDLKKSKKLSQEDYDYIKCTGSRCPIMSCNPEVHKKDMPLRPMISTTNSYNYRLAKYLTNLLEDARSKPESYVKDSFSFAKLIQRRKPLNNDIMVSLHAESLVTNIPVRETIELAINIIMEKKKKDAKYTKLAANDLRNLFELAVTNIPFRFYHQLYTQVDGVSIGSPLAPALADVFITHIEQQMRNYERFDRIKMYLRNVDDTFIIFNGNESDADRLVDFVNTLHPKVKFTREIEKNFELPFLDVKVLKQRTKFETTVYEKETHTGQLLHWQSCEAKKDKINLIKTLTYRALNICSSKQLFDKERKLIETTMIKNGYPVNFVRRKINNIIDQQREANHTGQNKSKKKLFIPITYHGNETIILSTKIKNMIESFFPTVEVTFGFRKGLTLAKLFMENFKGKDPMDIGVIYKLTCNTCDQVYIGQTKLNVNERMKQHKDGLRRPKTSRAADHMIMNENHIVNFGEPEIIGRDTHRKRREIKETLLTMQHQHTYNKISHELLILKN